MTDFVERHGGSVEDVTTLLGSVGPGYHAAPEVGAGNQFGRAGSVEEAAWVDVITGSVLPPGYDWGEPSTPDGIPPPLRGASGVGSVVTVTFCVDLGTHPTSGAFDPNNYKLEDVRTGRIVPVLRVSPVAGDATRVLLHVEEFPYLPVQYRLTVRRVENASGEPITTPEVTVFIPAASPHVSVDGAGSIFYGLDAGFQSDQEVGIEPDPPVVTPVDPIAGGFASEETNVTVDVTHAAAGILGSSVDIDFNVDGGALVPVYRGESGSQSGYTVFVTVITNGFRYVLNPAVDFTEDTQTGVFVRATDLGGVPVPVDTSYQWKVFKRFGVIAATQTDDFDVTLAFTDPMETAGAAGAALVNPASYQLNSTGLGVAGSVSAVALVSPQEVTLTISLITRGETYQIEVVGAPATAGICGEIVTGALGNFVSTTSLPRIVAVTPLSPSLLRVTFSREMQDNTDLIDVNNYRFSQGLFASSVARTGPTTVEVSTSRQLPKRLYSLMVVP